MKLFLNLIKTGLKSNKAQQVVNKAKQALRTEPVQALPGKKASKAIFGDMLVITEEEVLSNTSKKISTAVYANKGAHIGTGGSEGLEIFREKVITRKPNESILGGDIIEINKDYHGTISHSGYKEKIVKDYLPNGQLEHVEKTKTFRGRETLTVTDKTKSLVTGDTLYSMKTAEIKAKEAAQIAVKAAKDAEEKEIQEALQKAELDRIAKFPHVNVGKIFNKNIEEFQLADEKIKPNGEIIRKFSAKSKNGANQYIITKDIGILHEEHIVDTGRNIEIWYKFKNDGKFEPPQITLRRGLSYSQIDNRCIYDDGINRYETNRLHEVFDNEYPGILSGKLRNEYDKMYNSAISIEDFEAAKVLRDKMIKRISEIRKDMRDNCYIDLHDLYKPFLP